jgi:hypothetical protein
MVVLQCYAFIVIEIVETTVPDGPHIGLHIHFLLAFGLFVSGVCAYIVHAKIFVSSTFDISKYRKDMTKLDSLNAEIIEVSNCEKEVEDVVDNRRGACIEAIVTFLIFCLWVAYASIWRGIIISSEEKYQPTQPAQPTQPGEEEDDSMCPVVIFVSVIRAIELAIAAIMTCLGQRIMLK